MVANKRPTKVGLPGNSALKQSYINRFQKPAAIVDSGALITAFSLYNKSNTLGDLPSFKLLTIAFALL